MNIVLRLKVLLDELPAMVAYWDDELRNQYANQAYVEWFGLTPQDMLGKHIREVIGEQLFALNHQYIQGALDGVEQRFDRSIVDVSGEKRHTQAHYLPDQVDGKVVGFFVLVVEITHLNRVKEELSQAQRIGKLGSWWWDARTDHTHWSPELYRLFGRAPELPAPSYAELARYYTAQSWDIHNAGVERTLETGQPYELELEFVHEDGSHGWLVAHAQAQCDAQGKVVKLYGTAQDVTDRKLMELELLASRNELRDMMAHQEAAREEERRHIARELHDELGQLLSALNMDVGVLRLQADQAPHLMKTINDMQSIVDQIFLVTRSVTTSLRPAALDFGLVPALEWLADDFSLRWGIDVKLVMPADNLPLSEARAATLFRISQESLTNVARHAAATRVHLSLRLQGDRLRLCIQDNGRGFEVTRPREHSGFGLLSMRERVLSLGGTLQIDSAPDSGTTITVDIPTDPDSPPSR